MRFPFGPANDTIGQPIWALERTAPVRVLLIDDDDDEASLIRGQLARVGDVRYELDWVATYSEGLASINRHEHDAYLVDQQLGGRTGTDLVREARAAGSLAALIMMTGQRERSTDVAAMQAGATDYLMKGRTDAALLDRTLRYAMSQAAALAALERSRNQLAGLEMLGHILVDNGPRPDTMAQIVDLIVERFALPRVAIYLSEGDVLRLAAQRGHQHPAMSLDRYDAGVDRVARARQPIFVPSLTHDRAIPGAGASVSTELSVPLIVGGELAGLLNVASLVAAPIGEADFAAIRLVGERLTVALSVVHERTYADAMVQKARRQSATSESLLDGETAVYRRPLLMPLLDVAIASVRPGRSPNLNLLLIATDGAAEGFEHRLDRPVTAVFGNRPQIRFADGVHAVLMIATSPAATRSEARKVVAAAVAAGLDVWCGYAPAAAGSTAQDVVAAAELSLTNARRLPAGAIVG